MLSGEKLEIIVSEGESDFRKVPRFVPNETGAKLKLKWLIKANFDFFLFNFVAVFPVDHLEQILRFVRIFWFSAVSFDGEMALVPCPVVLNEIIDHSKSLYTLVNISVIIKCIRI